MVVARPTVAADELRMRPDAGACELVVGAGVPCGFRCTLWDVLPAQPASAGKPAS